MVLLDNGGGALLGSVRIELPPPDLRGLVEHVVVNTYPPRAREWRIVPDLSPHLIVSVLDDAGGRRARAVVVGARTKAAVANVSRRVVSVAVRLRPGSLPSLLGVSAAELTDRAVPLADAFIGRLLCHTQIGADTPPSLLASELLGLVRRAARVSCPEILARSNQENSPTCSSSTPIPWKTSAMSDAFTA